MNNRRNQRIPFDSIVRLTWTDGCGSFMARGTCEDICENGICIKIKNAIPVGTYVALSIERLGLRRSASVRHTARNRVTTFTLGLELSQPVPALAVTHKI